MSIVDSVRNIEFLNFHKVLNKMFGLVNKRSKIGCRYVNYVGPYVVQIHEKLYLYLVSDSNIADVTLENIFNKESTLIYNFNKLLIDTKFKSQSCYHYEFTLENAIILTKNMFCWLQLDSNNKVVIAISKDRIEFIGFIVGCILNKLKIVYNSKNELILQIVQTLQYPYKSIARLERYYNYFKNLMNVNTHQLIIRQIIISSPPIMTEHKEYPVLEIKTQTATTVIKDKDHASSSAFIIFPNIDISVFGEVYLHLYLEMNFKRKLILSLQFNSFFYGKGLVRFVNDEIELNDRIQIQKKNAIILDLIFDEDKTNTIACSYNMDFSLFNDLSLIISNFVNKRNDLLMNRFISMGFCSKLAQFGSYMEYSNSRMLKLARKLTKLGYTNVKTEVYHIIENPKEHTMTFKNIIENIYLTYEYDDLVLLSTLNKLDIVSIPKYEFKKQKLYLKKKHNTAFNINHRYEGELITTKPINWKPINLVTGSIFDDMETIKLTIDFSKFENLFCSYKTEIKSNSVKCHSENKLNHILDSKRLFFASLAFKYLEKKKYTLTPKYIDSLIINNGINLEVEELTNILELFPSDIELTKLRNATETSLSDIEHIILAFSHYPMLCLEIKLLLYQRNFIDKIFKLDEFLIQYYKTLQLILEIPELKSLFKILLVIGNEINFRYPSFKNTISGFDLDALQLFQTYANKNNKLLVFVKDTLCKNNISIEKLRSDLNLALYKNGDLDKLKQAINDEIEQYKYHLNLFIHSNIKDKKYHTFLNFVFDKLNSLKELYSDIVNISYQIKVYFGKKSSSEDVSEILKYLDIFLCQLHQIKL